MRQGNTFSQRCERDDRGRLIITVPMELTEEFEDCEYVQFYDCRTGYYVLHPVRSVTDEVQ